MTRTRSHSGLLETSFDDDDEDSVTQDKSCRRKQEKSDFQCQAGSDFETSDVIDVDEALGGAGRGLHLDPGAPGLVVAVLHLGAHLLVPGRALGGLQWSCINNEWDTFLGFNAAIFSNQ